LLPTGDKYVRNGCFVGSILQGKRELRQYMSLSRYLLDVIVFYCCIELNALKDGSMPTEFAPEPQATGLSFSLNRVAMASALAVFSLLCADARALGLGRLNVQSALGEPLRAEIDVTAMSPQEAASLKVRVASPQTYSAAGVDFNQALAVAKLSLERRTNGTPYLRLTSERAVTEPFVDAILDLQWASGRLVREYTLLFDPPSLARSENAAPIEAPPPPMTPVAMDPPAAEVIAAPEPAAIAVPGSPAPTSEADAADAMTAAPVAPPASPKVDVAKDDVLDEPPAKEAAKDSATKETPIAAQPSKPVASLPAKPNAAKPAPLKTEAAAKSADAAKELRVKAGDSISHLAEKTLSPGVSLDQMMVGLYRGNPQAFFDNNMNRLKSGVVLKVPNAESVLAVSPEQARQVIVAQSSDFEAYRQRLASGVTSSVAPAQQRQAAGKVEAEVTDRKQAEVPKPDKLTLSKGGIAAGKPVATEDRIAQNRAKDESTARVSELSRNLEDLRKMKEQAIKPVPVAPSPAPVSLAASQAAEAAAKAEAAAAKASAEAAATLAADMATQAAAQAAAQLASQAAINAPVIAAPVQVPPVADPAPEAPKLSLFERINPAALAGIGGLVALVAGGGLYLRSRRRKEGGETSFLESRLQPDSFFGASGGQRVDTHDAASPSSMSYSLSQLDAIGDVDPVAEADVYLAYGRDLQAEEILKEALRNNPQAAAVRAKLIEVYAKRRDTKGVEHVAKELFSITNGEGPDWQRAQELGLSVDPGNPLYQSAQVEQLPPSDRTLPMSGLPLAASANASVDENVVQGADLDLDISLPPTPEMLGAQIEARPSSTASAAASPPADADLSIEFDLPVDAPSASTAPAPSQPAAAPFDLSTISLDLDDDDKTLIKPVKPMSAEAPEFVSSNPVPMDVLNDPMMRKVELAHEFMQIGDVDGAKDLLNEVVAQGQEVTRAKARELLDRLT
jgi:pilus assembly protein FimV